MAWNSFLSIQTAKLNARKLFNLKNNEKKIQKVKSSQSMGQAVTSQVPSYAMDMATEKVFFIASNISSSLITPIHSILIIFQSQLYK